MKKSIIAAFSAIALTAGLAACGGSPTEDGASGEGDSVTFKFAMVDVEGTNYHKGAVKIAEEVEAATDGQIKIDVVAGGALGDERGTVEMAINGDLDIATAANPVVTNWIPEMSILDQAFLWENADQAHAAIDGPVGDLIEAAALEKGMRVIGYMEAGFRNVFSKDPITKIEDFEGVKIRTMQNEYHIAAFQAFGAMPVALPSGDQFTALQQGTIDAAENATSNMLANRFFEVITHHTTTEHAFVYILIIMSEDAWDRVPEDLRPAFLEAVEAGYKAQRDYLLEANSEAVPALEAEGVTFHEIDKAALTEAYEEAAAAKGFTFDPEWQAAVDEAKAN